MVYIIYISSVAVGLRTCGIVAVFQEEVLLCEAQSCNDNFVFGNENFHAILTAHIMLLLSFA